MAATLFAEPPSASLPEAVDHFMAGEKLTSASLQEAVDHFMAGE